MIVPMLYTAQLEGGEFEHAVRYVQCTTQHTAQHAQDSSKPRAYAKLHSRVEGGVQWYGVVGAVGARNLGPAQPGQSPAAETLEPCLHNLILTPAIWQESRRPISERRTRERRDLGAQAGLG